METWKDVLIQNLKYKKPNLVNAWRKTCFENELPLYVYVAYMNCGKQYFSVQTQGEVKKHYVQSCIAKFRNEDIVPFKKQFKSKIVTRVFRKDQSVFAKWREDDQNILDKCYNHDMQNWKLSKFVKEETDLMGVNKIIKKYYPMFKANHLFNSSTSTFPFTSLNDFTIYAKRNNLVDKNLSQSTIDRLFIAANVELNNKGNSDNPGSMLVRYEFIELIVRVANDKFKRFGRAETATAAIGAKTRARNSQLRPS